jgi:hypothetical protein
MRRRPIAYALLLWYLPACTVWHFEDGVRPQQLIAAQHPNAVRVTLPDRSRIVLHQPRIAAGDSLAGVLNGAPSSFAVSDVTQVAIRKISAGRTVLLVAGIAVVAAAIAVGKALSDMCILSCISY